MLLESEVLKPVGEGFDEAALEAISNFVFTPALNAEGIPTESYIQYILRFEPQKAPALVIKGTLLEAGIRKQSLNSHQM